MLHPLDILVLALYLSLAVWIGVRVGRTAQGLEGYLLGGRAIPWWAILGSIVATETSTATFLSVPGISFAKEGDFGFLQLAVGYIVGRVIVVGLFLPAYFQGTMLTAYQVLRSRYGPPVQKAASLLFLAARNLGDGLRLFLAAVVLQQVLGVSVEWCVLLVGTVTIVYTLLGGIKSVVWNDCIQFVIYIGGALVALTLLARQLPQGWSSIFTYAQAHDKFQMWHWEFDWRQPYTFWAGLVGGAFLTLGTHGTDQMMVQRLLGAGSLRGAAKALLCSGVVVFLQFALFLFVGVALATFYHAFPPDQPFSTNDAVFSRFIVEELPAGWGLIGLILAAVFAAAMSTLSSSLNASASAVVGDFLKPLKKETWSDARYVVASRFWTLIFGVLQMGVAVVGSHLSRSVVNEVLAIAGFTAGIMLGVFALAMILRTVHWSTGLAAMAGGAVVLLVIHERSHVAWPWWSVIGAVATIGCGLVFATITYWIRRKRGDLPDSHSFASDGREDYRTERDS